MKDIKNSDYQNQLSEKAKENGIWPSKKTNVTHLEIAAIFLTHCNKYFLNEKGRLAFVLPKSFLYAEQHHATRSGLAKNLKINEIWDLEGVQPLFDVPSCVFFTQRTGKANVKIPKVGLPGKLIKGRLKDNNLNLKDARGNLNTSDTQFYFAKLGAVSAITQNKTASSQNVNHYKKLFMQGATIVPRNLYFIEDTQNLAEIKHDNVFTAKTCAAINAKAKSPWRDKLLGGRVNGSFVYLTALAENILPFYLHEPYLTLLPAKIENGGKLKMYSSQDIFNDGEFETSKWFESAENIWESNKTEKSREMSNLDRLNRSGGLTKQNFLHQYVVLYTASGKDANSWLCEERNGSNFCRGPQNLPVWHSIY